MEEKILIIGKNISKRKNINEESVINCYKIYDSLYGNFFSLTKSGAEIYNNCKLYLEGAKMVESIYDEPMVELPDGTCEVRFFGAERPYMWGKERRYYFEVIEESFLVDGPKKYRKITERTKWIDPLEKESN